MRVSKVLTSLKFAVSLARVQLERRKMDAAGAVLWNFHAFSQQPASANCTGSLFATSTSRGYFTREILSSS